MNKRAKGLIILIILMLLATGAGCNMIQVDVDKDMERVVIEMGDEEIIKRDFNSYLTYHTLVYAVNGYSLPEGETLDIMKEDILQSMVEIRVLRKQAEELSLEVDLETMEEEVADFLDSLKTGLGEDKYLRLLSDNNMTQEEFESFFMQYNEDVRYANAAMAAFTENLMADSQQELEKILMTVNGESILKEELYYQLSLMEFDYYLSTGSGLPSDEDSLAYIYEEILDEILENRLIPALALEEGLNATDEEVEAEAISMKANLNTYFDEESLGTYLADYYLTSTRFEELLLEDARREVLVEKYKKSLEKGLTVTSEEIQEYYENNKENYDTDTVSAKHILTESEEYANELLDTITDAASFETAFALAQDDEQVKEAADLGAFSYGQMVTEFSDAAFSLEVGEVSPSPVESQFGYHIIYVYDRHDAQIPTLEEKTDEIRAGLITSKALDLYTENAAAALEEAQVDKEEIKEPFQVYLDDLYELYQVNTYPSRL